MSDLPFCKIVKLFVIGKPYIKGTPHHSCFLLMSWEKPTEIASLEGENRHCRTLQLGGLAESAAELLTDKGLTIANSGLQPFKADIASLRGISLSNLAGESISTSRASPAPPALSA
jgi:hypothetical protein